MKLYHGSRFSIGCGETIDPHVSFHGEELVYATSDEDYALVRAGRFNNRRLTFKEDYDGETFTLVELTPNAFEETFGGDGYVYTVEPSTFHHDDSLMPNEYISKNPAVILDVKYIENVGEEIAKHPRIKVIRFEDSDDYWKAVNGGKNGYLLRRATREIKLEPFPQLAFGERDQMEAIRAIVNGYEEYFVHLSGEMSETTAWVNNQEVQKQLDAIKAEGSDPLPAEPYYGEWGDSPYDPYDYVSSFVDEKAAYVTGAYEAIKLLATVRRLPWVFNHEEYAYMHAPKEGGSCDELPF